MLLDGLRPDDKRAVRRMVDALVARHPDVPSLRHEALHPSEELPPDTDRWTFALCHLSYIDGWYAHRQDLLEHVTALDAEFARTHPGWQIFEDEEVPA